MDKQKVIFVFSGSGLKFPAFIGGIKAYQEHLLDKGKKLEIVGVAGTSGGAIVASGIASGYSTVKKMESFCRKFLPKTQSLLSFSLSGLLRQGHGVYSTEKVHKLFKKHLVETIGDTVIPLKIATVNLSSSKGDELVKVWSSETDTAYLADITLASMSIPFVFENVKIGQERHADGGWLKNFPIDEFSPQEDVQIVGFHFGSNISSIPTIPWYRPIKRLITYIQHLLSMPIAYNAVEDIQDTSSVLLIKLRTSHDGLDMSISQDDITKMIQDGYNAAKQQLD